MGQVAYELSGRELTEQISLEAQTLAERIHTGDDPVLPAIGLITDGYRFFTPPEVPRTASEQYVDYCESTAVRLGLAFHRDVAFEAGHLERLIESANDRSLLHGVVVALPLASLRALPETGRQVETSRILNKLDPRKDVDGLGAESDHYSTTAEAAVALAEFHDSDFLHKNIAVRGLGRLFGQPLLHILRERGARSVAAFDIDTPENERHFIMNAADYIFTGAADPNGLKPDMFDFSGPTKTVIDVSKATDPTTGKLVGDVSDELRAVGAEHGWRFSERDSVSKIVIPMLMHRVVKNAALYRSERATKSVLV